MADSSTYDFYYFSEEAIRNACKNEATKPKEMNSSAKALFHSLFLRKKFERHLCFATSEVLNTLTEDKKQSNTFKHDLYLREALVEDDSKQDMVMVDGIPFLREMDSTLVLATIKAGDCDGKVKVVVPKRYLNITQKMVDLLELPLQIINEEQAAEELEQLHKNLLM